MWTTIFLLISSICYCQCTITWNSPTDGANITVYENGNTGDVIVTLNATTTGSTIFYSTVGDTPKFQIQNAVELALKAQLDFEVTSSYTVQLRALDDTNNEEADITINIVVLDVNDEEPVFTSPSSVTIATDTQIGSTVYTATADDVDTVGTLSFSIKSGNENQDFNINGTTGEITLNTALDIANKAEYDLVLEVTDGVFTVEKRITIYLTEVIWRNPSNNDNTTLPEDTAVDSLITNLSADNALIYSVVQSYSLFLIRNGNELYLADSLDYETTKTFTLDLRAFASSGRSADIKYTIIVGDVNDVALEFSSDTDTVDLSSDTDIGTVVYTAQTTDPDTVGSGPTYSITGGNTNDDFNINSTTGDITLVNAFNSSQTNTYTLVVEATDGIFSASLSLTVTVNEVVWTEPAKDTVDTVPENEIRVVTNLTAETAVTYFIQSVTPDENNFDIENNQLVLTSELDYESTQSYTLVLKAQDAGGKSATVTYIVNVTDVNDNEPVFQSENFLAFPEYTEVGTVVYTAETTDEDMVGSTTYSITGGNPDNTFSIDPVSGNLSLNTALSPRETEVISYSLILEADDTVHQVTLSLTVQVKTVPQLDFPENGTSISETENTMGTYVVLNLTSTDLDRDANPVYAIVDQSHPVTFALSDDNTQLITTVSFNYEDTAEFNVTMSVTDTSQFTLSSQKILTVYIINENDETPVFTSNQTLDLADNTPTGSTVYTATADDADNLEAVTFSITDGNADNKFEMDPNGTMRLVSPFNVSETLTYNLTIQASDTLNVETLVLTINIITEPQIVLPDTNITLDEGSYTSHTVWTLNSSDADNDPNPTYAIVEQSENGKFELSDDNMQLVTSATFDYENTTEYTVTLSVTDSSSLSRQSTSTVTVYIVNTNDEPPVFDSPAETEVREDAAIGYNVYNASTTDRDSPTAEVSYSVIEGNTDNAFEMDPDTGNLTVAAVLSTFSTLIYHLKIQANDTVNTATQTVNISVITAPVLEFPDVNITITENTDTTSGYEVLVFNSTDRDGDVNPSYDIVSQSDENTFYVSDDGTKLLTNASFDYETKTSYNVTLSVTDTSTFSMSSEATLTVYVADENDNAPEFTSNSSFELSEFTSVGTVVYTAESTDIDTETTVLYSIISGNTDDTFSINETSGEVSLAKTLQPDEQLRYDLELQANDTVQVATFNVTALVKTAPRFNISSNVSIPEDQDTSGPHTVLMLESYDPDGDTGVVYDIVSQSEDNTFYISADNTQLTTNATLDYESTSQYSVVLSATDDSSFKLSSNFTLTVFIEDVNDVAPVFTSDSQVDIPETQTIGDIFYTAVAFDNETVGMVSYAITDGDPGGYFSIDVDSGNMSLAQSINVSAGLIYNLTIQANDTVNTETMVLTVNVITVPYMTPLNFNISETEETYVIWNLTSNDLDGNQDPNYTIISQSDPGVFYISEADSAVVTNTSFDYETETEYTFTVRVTDTSSLKLSTSVTFTVSIINENDEKPEFNSSAEVQLREDTPTDTVVYTAVATDIDGIGDITFDIIAGNDNNMFEINAASGDITLQTNFNASATLTHTLLLQANDTVNINTMNVTFRLSTAPKLVIPGSVTIEENVDIGTDVLVLEAEDLDGDTEFSYELVSQSVPGTFTINENNTKLVTNASIDYDTIQNYTVTIKVTDTSQFNMTSTSNITVEVVDSNDEKPVFTSENSTVVAENTVVGSLVYTAEASDVDETGTIEYSIISGDTENYFSIDSANGSVTLVKALEPTTADDLTKIVVIQANDSVNIETLNVTFNIITVPVLNVNNITLPEDTDTTGGYTVWTINSTDLDGDNNTYAITEQSEPNIFTIDGNKLVSSYNFDYETVKNYSVVINVTDSSVLRLSSEEMLYIFIEDANDNAPMFTSNNSVYVLQTANIGDVVYTATAEDVDTIGNFTYNITAGNRNSDFQIDTDSGEVTLQNELNPQTVDDIVYNIVIEVNDTVNIATLNLTVNIRTVPYLNVTDQQIPENTDTSGPYSVWTIDWSDLDSDTDPAFEIISESVPGTFQIVNDSLVTNASFDYESTTNYTATIRITDGYNLSSNDTITINIIDLNDVAPEFQGNTTLDLWEATAVGDVVYEVTTSDPDTLGTLHYSITGGNSADDFEINATSGNLSVKSGLDFATTSSYTLTITANDSVNTADFNLTINIKTSPVLNFTGITVEVSEDAEVSAEVLTLNATDPDSDPNPVYTIISQSVDGTFVINGDKLVTNATLDYEDIKNYTLDIMVTDSGLGLTSNDTLTVLVTDVNDNSPIFTSSNLLEIREDTPVNDVVYTAEASDADSDTTLSYSIIDGNTNSDFAMDSDSGNITLNNALDPDTTLTYSLVLQVNDSLHTSTMNLTISVKTAPVFDFPENITIPETVDTSGNLTVWTLMSTDLDGDINPSYEIVNQSVAGTFFINAENTKLLTNARFNYSELNEYEVTLRVTDSSNFTMSSVATLTVYISDANNVPPTFTSAESLEIPETQANGSVVYTAIATDPDTFGEITFALIGGNTNSDFEIHPQSGNLTLVNSLQPSLVLQYDLVIQANDSINAASLNLSVSVKSIPMLIIPDQNLTVKEDVDTSMGPYTVHELNSTDLDMDPNPSYTILSQTVNETFEIANDTKLVTSATFDYENLTSYEVVVQVTDTSAFSLSSSVTFTVYILDDNDVAPKFTSETETFIAENEGTGVVFYTATTDDPDTVGSVTYLITDGDPNGEFIINATSGELALANELNPQSPTDLTYFLLIEANDTENTATLNFTVHVRTVPTLNITDQEIKENTDTSGPYSVWTIDWSDLDGDIDPAFEIISESVPGTFQIVNDTLVTNASFDFETITNYTVTISITDTYNLTSNGTLTLFVTDVNDVPPTFTSNTTLDVWEKTQTGTVLYTVITDDPDSPDSVTYSISDGNDEGKFELDANSGNLTLVNNLDFRTTSSYTLRILANDSINTATLNLTVNVKTSPVLNFTGISVEVSEDAEVSTEVLTLNATDPDSDPNPVYTIISQSVDGTFVINGDKIFTNATLDYEDVKNYNITIQVTDSSLGLTSSDMLTVFVIDVNDNMPNFTSDSTLEIREDEPVGNVVYTAEVIDIDTSQNFSFSITGGNTDSDFDIDSVSGNITLNNPLNASASLSYNLILQVNDSVNINSLTLEISVKTAPELVLPDYNLTISEKTNTTGNYSVWTLSYTDLDGDQNPTYEIVNQSNPDTFFINAENTEIITNTQFNFSAESQYEVTIRVTDSSDFRMSSTGTLTVYITDANNVPPVITSPRTLDIKETQAEGSVVYNVTARDPDTGTVLVYSIIGGNDDGDFSLDPDSGSLTLNKTLRPSDILKYVLQIQVNDTDYTAAINLTINVKTQPKIVLPEENVTIQEDVNTSGGTYNVLELNSTDLDDDPDPVYSILSQTVNGTFEIVNNTKLVTSATFDYESIKSYEIVIQVTDTSSFTLSSSVTLTVTILDTNDIAPVFTSDLELNLPEDEATGKVVYTAKTYDNDTSGTVTYSIIGGNTGNDFSIDETTGDVMLENNFRPGAVIMYILQIQANDTVNQAVLNLTVNVVTAPILLFPAERIVIPENFDKSTDSLVWICNSQDVDGDPNPTYSIVSQSVDGVFELNNDNTRLITTATFDYENRTSYDIILKVTDSSPLALSSTATLTVYIGNLNDEIPVFTSPASVKVTESTEIGSVVYTAVAEDPDGVLTYTITGGNTNGDFSINETSGRITLEKSLNMSVTANYSLVIQANDTVNTEPYTVLIEVRPDINKCEPDPCENGATCINGIDEYTCVCPPGYIGTNCTNEIDECASLPCQNGATCNNLIGEYSCTCAAGYTGTHCENECQENTYGENCAQQCNCYGPGTESCDHVNGTCYCNGYYSGTTCNTDIDECARNNTCTKPNEGCDNTVGSYQCDCFIGYTRNATNDCVPDTTPTTTTSAPPASRTRVKVRVTLNVQLSISVDLTVKATNDRYKQKIQLQLDIRFRPYLVVNLVIRRGSVIAEFDVITDTKDISDVTAKTAELATDGQGIEIFNQTAQVSSMEVNNNSVPVGQYSDSLVCDIFGYAEGKCTDDNVCSVQDGKPSCQLKDTEDNLPLILGLGVGIPAFFVALAVVILCTAYYNNKRKMLEKRYRGSNEEMNDFYKMPVRANTGPPTWPFIASPEHAEYLHNSEYSSRDESETQKYAEDFNGYYDNRAERDNNYTWDYLYPEIRQGEPYHIRRPKMI